MYSLFIKMSTKYIKPLFKLFGSENLAFDVHFFISNDDFSLKDNVTG